LIEEAVVNSIRHGKATEIQVSGSGSGDFITVQVRDNGSFTGGKSHRGLGTILFETFADSWQLEGGSNGSTLTFTVDTNRTEARR
jgi:anti-sigma regulatory factor (Ser/Thr protein kinase)